MDKGKVCSQPLSQWFSNFIVYMNLLRSFSFFFFFLNVYPQALISEPLLQWISGEIQESGYDKQPHVSNTSVWFSDHLRWKDFNSFSSFPFLGRNCKLWFDYALPHNHPITFSPDSGMVPPCVPNGPSPESPPLGGQCNEAFPTLCFVVHFLILLFSWTLFLTLLYLPPAYFFLWSKQDCIY